MLPLQPLQSLDRAASGRRVMGWSGVLTIAARVIIAHVRTAMAFVAALLLATACVAPLSGAAAGVIVVPPGNGSQQQPTVDRNSVARTRETGGTFEGKYQQIYRLLQSDRALMARIKSAAQRFGIDPVHMLGAIVAEHTFNVDAIDSAQGYYIKAMAYLGTPILFQYKGVPVSEFVAKEQFDRCRTSKDDFDLWDCREEVWRDVFRGNTVDGVSYPDDRFGRVFFQPLYAGQTFGLGQLSPIAALSVADIVHKRSGLPLIDMDHAPELYSTIMDPATSLEYLAALIRLSIDSYRDLAGFDISKNPGLTATLYNVGDARDRARRLAATNRQSGATAYPQVNYFGWFVNEKEDDLRRLLQ
ncbi:Protein of unknown function [Pseudoxanthobacter soli DSM 19599]|uniref:DUF1402 family protein n=2 Tax=Pseudoxanthobacter TaxID=433838 RepID=A0A1M7ZE67_9HYPH|nr:DUF1402 family protein [Pseudoxanthobacter soli]SHO63132.1 Protein of unknown function [Pseudoxanthobacter soli DSM 19599]